MPPTAKIAKDAKECVQECVSEFISFITSEAAEKCLMEKRKTIGGEDILYAMGMLGFENYAETLKIHLAKLRQVRAFSNTCLLVPSGPRANEPLKFTFLVNKPSASYFYLLRLVQRARRRLMSIENTP